MKKYILLLLLVTVFSCPSDDSVNPNCNFLPNIGINYPVNLNLPFFSNLNITGGVVRVDGQGVGGIILINNGNRILAWDGADPNEVPSNCSTLVVNGTEAESQCADGTVYSLFSGRSVPFTKPCTLKRYFVEDLGNNTYLVSN